MLTKPLCCKLNFYAAGGHAVKPYAFYPQDAGGAVSGSVYMPPHPERGVVKPVVKLVVKLVVKPQQAGGAVSGSVTMLLTKPLCY